MTENYNVNSEQGIQTLDLALLQGYMDSLGNIIVDKMFSLYKQQVILYLSDIENAQLEDSGLLWQESCHKMKGASGSVGLIRLHGMLVTLEKVTASKSEKAVLLNELKDENEKAITAFQHWLTKVSN